MLTFQVLGALRGRYRHKQPKSCGYVLHAWPCTGRKGGTQLLFTQAHTLIQLGHCCVVGPSVSPSTYVGGPPRADVSPVSSSLVLHACTNRLSGRTRPCTMNSRAILGTQILIKRPVNVRHSIRQTFHQNHFGPLHYTRLHMNGLYWMHVPTSIPELQ